MPKKKQTKARNMFTVAPGGERAKEEPCQHPSNATEVTANGGIIGHRCNDCGKWRPAEPEPPKVDEARMLELAKERAALADRVFVHVPHPMDGPPKADTGTLEAQMLEERIERAIHLLSDTLGAPFFIAVLRDALTEIRRLRWQRDSEQAKLSATLMDLVSARASSPDLRARIAEYVALLRRTAHAGNTNASIADELESTLRETGDKA